MKNKIALIISPEVWGVSKLSKHHYAIALTKHGYKVYFLTTENSNLKNKDTVCNENKNIVLTTINLSPILNKLRFYNRLLYNYFLSIKVKEWVLEHETIDWLISFERSGVFTNLSNFKSNKTIFFPVDLVESAYISEYKGFDKLVSITPVILEQFSNVENKLLEHHGLSSSFELNLDTNFSESPETIAYVGNLLIGPILDKVNLRKIVKENSQIKFHFYGSYLPKNNNLGGCEDEDTLSFIDFLMNQNNCVLHGAVPIAVLSESFKEMDGFLICYDHRFDKNKCSNSHKIMEYLSTGKPIIATRISMYDNLDLFPMLNTFDNTQFPAFFKAQIDNWDNISNLQVAKKRITFASENLYDNKIQRLLNI